MSKINSFSKNHSVSGFVITTFVVSWGAILFLVGPGGFPVATEQTEQVGLAILLGPSIAGILFIGMADGKAGYRKLFYRLLRWRVGLRWYAVALLSAPITTAAALLALSLISPEFRLAPSTADDRIALVLMGIAAGLVVGCFEELGWTGFAIPHLRLRHSVLTTGLIVGLVWGAWHFILFWERDSFSDPLSLAILLGRLFSWLPAYRILMVWIYDRTGSLLVAILMHLSLVASLVILEPALTGSSLLTYILVRAALLWAVVVAVAMTRREQLLKKAADAEATISVKA